MRSLMLMGIALGTSAAASPSTAMVNVLDLKVTADPESSVEEPMANGIAPSAVNPYVPVVRSWTSAALMVVVYVAPASRSWKFSVVRAVYWTLRRTPWNSTAVPYLI